MDKLETLFQELIAHDNRYWPRKKCSYITQYYDFMGYLRECRVIDIGGSGVGVVFNSSVRRGETVKLVNPDIKATVIWVDEGRAGLKACH